MINKANSLEQQINIAEKNAFTGKYRMGYHLMPPTGWLNDPNGLCQLDGIYHVFFQYSPLDPNGGVKVWGHYASPDLIHWEYLGTPLLPEEPLDKDGVYSGSALVEDGGMALYYTGNVKLKGDYDYIRNGRISNTILVTSEDGRNFSEKKCLLTTSEYKEGYTNHIRDPKVFKQNGKYEMLLGGRKDSDQGAVLLYESQDKVDFKFCNELTSKELFGYMWECPDILLFDEEWFLSISPQGVKREEFKHQNIYLSGYMKGSGDYHNAYVLGEFVEWDMGFDFYAPQTFVDESGRRILIGWAGLPDIEDEYENKSVKEGWQHALTLPRVITKNRDKLLQYPVKEINELRGKLIESELGKEFLVAGNRFDLELTNICSETIEITIANGLKFTYKDGICSLTFTSDIGAGRKERKAKVDSIHSIRMLLDVSILEIYLNNGEMVFTTRLYVEEDSLIVKVDTKEAELLVWTMNEMEVKGRE